VLINSKISNIVKITIKINIADPNSNSSNIKMGIIINTEIDHKIIDNNIKAIKLTMEMLPFKAF